MDIQNVREGRGMYTGFGCGNLRKTENLQGLDVKWRISKCVFRNLFGGHVPD